VWLDVFARWFQPAFVLRTVIVNLQDDPTAAIQGALWSVRGPWFTLRRASMLKAGADPTPLDGDIVIHRNNVSFIQVLP
jgi:hypothetical protein